jgi:osmotically-inducible protein OsmY
MPKPCDSNLPRVLIVALLAAALPAFGQSPSPEKETARDASTLDDTSISDAIDRELTTDRAGPGYRINVRTNNGIVSLSGKVTNLLAKKRAARIAETVKGCARRGCRRKRET